MILNIITSNVGKYKEYSEILDKYNIATNFIKQEYIEIQANTIEEVVELALISLSEKYNYFMIDDSGLFIDCLSGFPGVYSSYVFKTLGNEKILNLMENEVNRNAYFKTVIGLSINRKFYYFTGVCKGAIAMAQKGKNGFGYDPIFIPANENRTFSEFEINEKNKISHRGLAALSLIDFLNKKVL
jgi:XTP/dITP diphosphohydrolase